MRKITRDVVGAFLRGESRNIGNMSTDGTRLWLHGNMIARKENGHIIVTTCGWNTLTTRERLNAIPGVSVNVSRGVLYLNDKRWDGGEKEIR